LAAASALAAASDGRMMDLSIALADARSRLLPAMGGRQTELQATLHRLANAWRPRTPPG
jgi:hypothetical protein